MSDVSNLRANINGVFETFGVKDPAARQAANAAESDAKTALADAKTAGEAVTQLKSAIDALKIVDTASGAIASFPDGAAMPVESLTVEMNPIQDLHGQDAPYPAGGGKNLLPPATDSTETRNGITWIRNSDGSISFTGTCTESYATTLVVFKLPAGDYLFSNAGSTTDYTGGTRPAVYMRDLDGSATLANIGFGQTSNGIQFTLSAETNIRFYVVMQTNNVVSGIFYPMIRLATVTDATFAPYSNICPITGRDSVTVTRSGANIWDEEWETANINWTTYIFAPSATGGRLIPKNYIQVVPGATYYARLNRSITIMCGYTDAEGNGGRVITVDSSTNLFTIPNDVRYIKFGIATSDYGTTYNHDISINYPSTDTAYHPGTVASVEVQLGQTVYGGTVDVTGGELANGGVLETITAVGGEIASEHYYRFVKNVDVLENCTRIALIRRSASDGLDTYSNNFAIKICNSLPHIFSYANDTPHWYINNQIYIYLPVSIGTTYEEIVAYLAEHPIQIYIPYATPLEITLDPATLSTLKSTNNVWSDGDSVSVEYVADPKLYIARLTEPDADMVADANITSGKYFMVGNTLYLATANIASGAAITPGVNCTKTNLAAALNAINA